MESSQGNQIFGRVYKIVSSETDDVYVGSTEQTLNERFSNHKRNYKLYLQGKYHTVKSFDIVKFRDARIELLSEGLFDTKEDLRRLEGEFMAAITSCINKCMAGRTKLESAKAYRDSHKEEYKAYLERNKERISQQKKDRYQEHKDEYLERVRRYKEENKSKIADYKGQKITCPDCQGIYSRNHKARHEQSNKHKLALLPSSSS
jgi:hypothetical protein